MTQAWIRVLGMVVLSLGGALLLMLWWERANEWRRIRPPISWNDMVRTRDR